MHVTRPRWAASAHPLWAATFAALVLAIAPEAARAQAPAKLLLQSIVVLGTPNEYVAIYNPTGSAVDLSNYYLTDALFTGQSYGYLPDPTKRNTATAGGGMFTDWHVQFPAGAMIAAGDTVAVAIQGAAAFNSTYGRKPAFEIVSGPVVDDPAVPNMRPAFSGSVPVDSWSLTNGGESVTLYYWDQASDLVVDIDYVVWGTDTGQYRYFNNKTGITVDGPDADTNTSAYLPDTAPAQQIPVTQSGDAHAFGNSLRRESYTEGTQATTGGNGVGGRNETSENLATTWSTTNPASPPFVKGGAPAVLTARAGGPYTGTVNTPITFNGSQSTPAAGETITAYSWMFGDSGTGTGANPQHTYTTAGSYTVTLTVTGSGGGTASSTATATVTGGEPPPSSATKLLIQGVVVLGTPNEYVAIYNPSSSAVDLSNYYLTDALFTAQSYGYLPDPTKRNTATSGGGMFTDWHVRFPAGAMIAAGDTIAVAIQGAAAFNTTYGRKPAFEIVSGPVVDDSAVPNMREAFPGSVPVDSWSLTNGGESVTLYFWDQASDLVTDIDYVVWGTDTGQYRFFNNKTGITVDGPDADTNTSAYLPDTAPAQQNPITESGDAHPFGNMLRREDFNEGSQRTTGGNGVGGRDETSENLRTTFSTTNLAVPPFVKGSAPAVLTARPGGPYTGTVNTPVTFNGSQSTPAAGGTITAYSWMFGDGGTGTGANPQHTYTTAGTYTVTLTVTGSGGGTASATTTATITSGEPPPPSSATKLLLQGVVVLGTPNEYVAIYNPSSSAVDLSNYYLTDALFTGQSYGYIPDPTKRNTATAGGGMFTDWHVRFPAGATIAAGDTIAVAIQGAAAFMGVYGRKPAYEIVAGPVVDDSAVPNMREAFPGSVPVDSWSLTNGGESVTLYFWDQASDLVVDIDYVVWGTDTGQYRFFNNKTGITVDGPDAGTATSAYAPDTPPAQQNPITESGDAHAFGNMLRRENYSEGTQKTTGGNGVGGRDETSENLRTTWSTTNAAAPPFVKGSAPPPPGNLTAFISGTPLRGTVGQSITFNGSQSTPKTGETITNYAWNFGDGATATGAIANHAYAAAGTYTASLTVTGSGGGTNTATTTVSITVPSEGALQLLARTFMPTIGETYPITTDVASGLIQTLRVYDLEGREVKLLLDEPSTGKKTTTWDGRDEELMLVASGTYIVHLETRDEAGHVQNYSGPIVVARRLERN
jgi:PKD repeat protein